MLRVVVAFVLLSAAMIGIGHAVFSVLPGFFYQTVILLFVTSIGLHQFLTNARRKNSDLFVPLYLATLAIKLIAFGGYVFLMAQQQPEMTTQNVAFFLAGYVIFTAVETVFLYRIVNNSGKS
ncbi:MAG: hypothetical protein JNK18_07115 [Cyclobacteriaceae bacterium]|nr:hypothetical protein [Cyclobacteriaceae bacterium]